MRRTVLLLASMALVVPLASGVAWAATNTFSNTTQITMSRDGAVTPYPSAISVSGLGTVTDVDLRLNGFSHTYPDDVEVDLVGSRGQTVTVMSDAGGSYDVSNINLTLDDEASSELPYWDQLSSGAFRPSSPLSVFDGTNPNGVWELYVDRKYSGDSGRFSGGWSLTITSEGPVEPPPTDDTPPDTSLIGDTPSEFDSNVNRIFSFRSSKTGSTFECKLDGGAYQSCTSPKKYFLVDEGEHTFQVRARDAAGNIDATPAEHTWTVDSLRPKVTFTERPGTATGSSQWDEWVTNDRTPTWAWTVQDPNSNPDAVSCDLDQEEPYRDILYVDPCSSPYISEAELPDGHYSFEVEARDMAGNYGYGYNAFEVDTVAPKFVSGKPTGKSVGRYANVVVTFDDNVYKSAKFVNIYKKGTSTPLAVYRQCLESCGFGLSAVWRASMVR